MLKMLRKVVPVRNGSTCSRAAFSASSRVCSRLLRANYIM